MRFKKGFVLSGAIFAFLSLSQNSYADNWGCEVLLCLSNPAGATAVSECKPPIHKLYRALSRGKPFPTCEMAGSDKNYAQYVRNEFYTECPKDMQPLRKEQKAIIKGSKKILIGKENSTYGNDYTYYPRICVGGFLGKYNVANEDNQIITVDAFETVQIVKRKKRGESIRVFNDGKHVLTVRPFD